MSAEIDGYRIAYNQVYKLKEKIKDKVEKKRLKKGKAYFICKGFPIYTEKDLLDVYQSDYLHGYEYDRYKDKLETLQKTKNKKTKDEYALEALNNICELLMNEIKEMEFEALPQEEQRKLLEERNLKAGLEV